MNTSASGRVGVRLTLSLFAVTAFGAATAVTALAADPPQANASAQVDDVNIPGVYTYTASLPATSATNDGSGSTAAVIGTPHALPNSVFDQSSQPQYEQAQAGTNGTSWACAVNGGVGISVTNGGQDCASTGNFASTIIRLDSMPIIGNALASTVCPQMRLSWRLVIAHAYDDGTGSPTGATAIPQMTVSPCTLAGQPADCRALPFTPDLSPNADLFAEILAVMSAHPDCDPMTAALNSVASNITFRTNEQSTLPDGSFQVIGMHFVGTGTPSSFAISRVTVGPNAIAVVDTPMVSIESLSIAATALLVAVALAAVVRRRKLGGAMR